MTREKRYWIAAACWVVAIASGWIVAAAGEEPWRLYVAAVHGSAIGFAFHHTWKMTK